MAYIAALKSLMATCKYSNAEYNNQLRDRLLHGCNDREMQRKIIEVGENLTCGQAIEAALNCEARQSSLDLMNTGTEEQVHATYQQNRRREACWRCKGAHPAIKCPFIHESVTFVTKSDTCVVAVQTVWVNVLELAVRILLLRVNVLDPVKAETDRVEEEVLVVTKSITIRIVLRINIVVNILWSAMDIAITMFHLMSLMLILTLMNQTFHIMSI